MATHAPLPPEMWDRTPREAQEYILALEARVASLEATVQALLERLQQDSRPSSRPPSRDPPQRVRPRRQPSGRHPGGQPGHQGQTCTLVPVAEVDVVLPRKPEPCARGPQPSPGDEAQPQRHHVVEMPPLRPVMTAYPWPQWVCPGCGDVTRAAWPDGGPTGTSGPRVHAMTALGTGAYRLSQRTTQRGLDDLCGLPRSLGTIATLEAAATQAVAVPGEDARAHVQEQATASLDDTGWREDGQRAWVWVAVPTWVTVCLVRLSRGGQVARARLGAACDGILVTARWSADTWYPVRWRPRWWAPLWRDIAAMIDRGGRSQAIGDALQTPARQMVYGWPRGREGTRKRSSFRSSMRPRRRAVDQWHEAGCTCGSPKTEGVCRESLKVRPAWWTFVPLEGVEPTHTAAERAMRPGVRWRTGRCGTHSAQGSRVVEAMRTVVATLKQPHRHPLEFPHGCV